MAQETRKDPRAKVLTVTVRYKSATLDEFIEHHSHDVSRGGMFIKTVSPFPPGTLLKIEVRIAGDQRVMQGVGRVVWKRESGEQHDGAPAGMGVKFIKIDDASRQVIDQLVAKSGGAVSAFDKGSGDAGTAAAAAAPAEPSPAKPAIRKATMIGLGAMGASEPPKADEKEESTEGFFPTSEGAPEQPAPEDRTVMKQAAELLQDALREAGGSLEDVGTPGTPAASSHPPPPVYEAPRPGKSESPAAGKSASPPAEAASKSDKPSEKPAEKKPESARPAASSKPASAAAKPASSSRTAATQKATSPASARRVPVAAQPIQEESGSGRMIAIVLGLVAVVGVIVLVTHKDEQPPPAAPTEVKATPPAAATPAATAPAEPATPPVALSALPAESANAKDNPVPTPPEPGELVNTPEPAPAPTVEKKPKPAAVTPKPVQPKAPAEPKPAAPSEPKEPAAAAPAPEPKAPAPTAAPEPKAPAPAPTEAKAPAEPKPAVEPKAPAEPKPAPAPKPKKSDSDNPF